MDSSRKNKSARYFVTIIVSIALSIHFFIGCSYQRSRDVLSIFFDGVPDTTSQNKSDNTVTQIDTVVQNKKVIITNQKEPEVIEYSHLPFKEEKCKDCHSLNLGSDLLKPQPDLCYECHEDFSTKKYVHGPVAVGYCLTCHNAHKSPNKYLILRTGTSLCTYCHTDKIEIKEGKHPQIGDELCWKCHSPHSNDNEYLLHDVSLAN